MNSFETETQLSSKRIDPHRYEDDEIDLLELFAVLWKGKWIIAAVVIFSAIGGFTYLKSQPSIYRVETLLGSTTSYDLSALQPSILEGGQRYQAESLEKDEVYRSTLALMSSINTKRRFWEFHTGQPLPSLEENGDDERVQAFKGFVGAFDLSTPDLKSDENTATLALESENPAEAATLLDTYLKYVNTQTVSRIVQQLKSAYEANIQRLNFDYETLKSKELQKLDDQLLRLNEAHDLAKALNIVDTPYEQVENVELKIFDNREYLLGTKALAQEIKSLQLRREKPIEAFVPQLRNMELWKLQMEHDLNGLKTAPDQVQAFVVVSPPESSLTPVKPKKALIFIAIVFCAAFVGVLIVFVIHGVKTYQARSDVN